jgi:hypothetical protein
MIDLLLYFYLMRIRGEELARQNQKPLEIAGTFDRL